MAKIAFIFPGQGAQYVGMAQDFYETCKESKQIFDIAQEKLDINITELCFTKNELLNITEYTQIAMLTVCVAMLKKVESLGIKADVTAGLSLGEYPALVANGVLDFEDSLMVVRQRGKLMQEAVPVGLGAMAAILGFDEDLTQKICEETPGIVTIANYNCPGQIVISGEIKAVEEASLRIKEVGAKRVIPLNVSGPFHSPMLKGAGEELGKVLNSITIHKPIIPYVDNTNAKYITDVENIKDLLEKQVSSSVMWKQSVELMIANGVDTFIEIGPGKTLTSFVKKIKKECTTINIEKIEDLEKLQEVPLC